MCTVKREQARFKESQLEVMNTQQSAIQVEGNLATAIMVADKGPYSMKIGDGFVEFSRRNNLPAWEAETVYDACKAEAMQAVAVAHNAGKVLSVKFASKFMAKENRWQPTITVRREAELPVEQHKELVAKAIATAEKKHSEKITMMRKYAP